jgi:hypothetical protein
MVLSFTVLSFVGLTTVFLLFLIGSIHPNSCACNDTPNTVSRNYLGNILNYSNRHLQLLTHTLKSVTSLFTRPKFNVNPFHGKILREFRREIGRQSLRYLLHLSEGDFYKMEAHKGNVPEGGCHISTLTCLTATSKSALPSSLSFDTDSGPVGIDNRCSVCMSHVKSDFVGELVESALDVTGFHGTKRCQVYRGTIKWCIADDKGVVHNILIPGSYYVPSGNHRLISPQHPTSAVQAALHFMIKPYSHGITEGRSRRFPSTHRMFSHSTWHLVTKVSQHIACRPSTIRWLMIKNRRQYLIPRKCHKKPNRCNFAWRQIFYPMYMS